LHELVPPLSYFFLVLCFLAPLNLKRSLKVLERVLMSSPWPWPWPWGSSPC